MLIEFFLKETKLKYNYQKQINKRECFNNVVILDVIFLIN